MPPLLYALYSLWWLFSLAVHKQNFMLSYLSVLSQHSRSWKCFSYIFLSQFKSFNSYIQVFAHFELILSRMSNRHPVSTFYIWPSRFPTTVCRRYCLFSNICLWYFCCKLDDCSCVYLLLTPIFYTNDLQKSTCLFFCQ